MRIVVVLASLLLASAVCAKDLVVRQRSSAGMTGSGPNEETIYLTNDKIVSESPEIRRIVDIEKKTITAADKTNKTYSVITFDELRTQMDAIRKSLESLPPEARKQMAALFDDSEPVTVTASGQTETIAGYPSTEYVLRGGPYSGSVWTTEAIDPPAAFTKWKSIEPAPGGAAKRLGEAMAKLKGFPMRTKIEMKAGPQPVTLSNEVLEVKEASPPAAVVTVPKGFTKQTARSPVPGQ